MADIWARKSIDLLQKEAEGEHSEATGTSSSGLSRTLGVTSVTALGIGALIGAGIFVLTGQAAAEYAGPAIILSFILSGVICLFAGLCYSEMAACCPVAGSAYTYAFATMGEIVAWMIGWDLILEYAVGGTTVAIGWSGYVASLLKDLGLPLPAAIAKAPFAFDPHTHAWSLTGAVLNVPAMAIIIAVTTLLVVGVKESARVNNVIVALKIAIVVLFVVVGFWYVKQSNWVVPGKNPRARSSRPTTAPSASTAGPASCAGGGWCSSPMSGSTRSRRRRRRPSTRNATCRSASCSRWASAPCSTSRSATSSPASSRSTS